MSVCSPLTDPSIKCLCGGLAENKTLLADILSMWRASFCVHYLLFIYIPPLCMLRGNLFAGLLTRTPGGKTCFHCSRQDCAHRRTHTKMHTSHSGHSPPLSPATSLSVTTAQVAFRDTEGHYFSTAFHLCFCLLT